MPSAWPRGGLWRHRDFLLLWGSQSVSQVGTQVSILALPLVAVLTLDASAFEVALLTTLEYLPWLLLALPAGVWVDRLTRRPMLVVTDVGRALALASVPLAHALGVLTVWQLDVVAFSAGALTVFFDVAYQSYLPSLVSRDQLVDGNAKLAASMSAAQVAGPGLGGGLVAAVTAPYAIFVDAVSFVGSALLLGGIRTRERAPAASERVGMRRELLEGLRYLVAHRHWRALAASTGAFNLFGNVWGAIVIVYMVRSLDLSPGLIGVIFAVGGVGSVAGAALAPSVSRRLGVGPAIVASAALSGLPMLLVPLAPVSHPIPFIAVGWGLTGAGIMIYNISAISLMQALTPERLLGRLNASRRFIVWGTIPLGSLLGGALAATIGLRPTIFVGTILGSLAFLFVAVSPVRSVRELPDAPEQEARGPAVVVPPADA